MPILADEFGWRNQTDAGNAMEMSQTNYSRFFAGDQGINLSSFGLLCRNLDMSPVEILVLHPKYSTGSATAGRSSP